MLLAYAVEKAAGVVCGDFCYTKIDNLPFLSSFSNNIVKLKYGKNAHLCTLEA
jgi:hypothetical protein